MKTCVIPRATLCVLVILGMVISSSGQFQTKPTITIGGASRLIDIVVRDNRLMLNSKNVEVIAPFLKAKTEKMLEYMTTKYPAYGMPAIDVNDPAAPWFGLICAMYEANEFKPLKDILARAQVAGTLPAWLTCALSVIGVTIGVTELVGTLGAFTYASVWSCVKFVVKKYVTGWLGTAIALYEIATECF